MLWAYAAENQTDGDFSDEKKYPATILAKILCLPYQNPEAMVARICKEMLECGFFEPGSRKLHDWAEWNGFHEEVSQKASRAAKIRWDRERQRREGGGKEPPPDPPPPKKRKAQVPGKVHPDQGTNNTQNARAKADRNTPANAGKPEKSAQPALNSRERFKARMDAERQVKAIKELMEKHSARPGNATLWKSEIEKKRAKEDFWQLSAKKEDLLRQIATL